MWFQINTGEKTKNVFSCKKTNNRSTSTSSGWPAAKWRHAARRWPTPATRPRCTPPGVCWPSSTQPCPPPYRPKTMMFQKPPQRVLRPKRSTWTSCCPGDVSAARGVATATSWCGECWTRTLVSSSWRCWTPRWSWCEHGKRCQILVTTTLSCVSGAAANRWMDFWAFLCFFVFLCVFYF